MILNKRLGFFIVAYGGLSAFLLARDLAIAYIWGASELIAHFMTALIVPVILMSILGSSLSNVLIAVYLKKKSADSMAALRDFANQVFGLAMAFHALVFIAAYLLNIESKYGAALVLYGFLFSLASIPRTILVAEKADRPVLLAPVIANCAALVVLLLLYREFGILALAWSYVTAAFLELMVLLWAAARIGIPLFPKISFSTEIMALKTEFGYVAGASALMSLAIAIDQTIARSIGVSALPQFNYATKIPAFFISALTAMLSIYLYPHIASIVHAEDRNRLIHLLKKSWLMVLSAGLPLCILLMIFSDVIVGLLFQRGAFTPVDTDAVAQLQKYLALQLPPYFFCLIASQILLAQGKARLIFVAGLLNTALKVAFALALSQAFGLNGLGMACASVQWILAIVLFVMSSFVSIKSKRAFS